MIKTLGTLGAGLLALLIVVFSFSGTIDQGERGVKLRNGAITAILEPGRYYKLPIIESVVEIPVTVQTLRWGTKDNVAMQAYTQDQQPVDISMSVTFIIPSDPKSVAALYSEYGSVENLQSRLLYRVTPQQVKIVTGQFNATRAISERAILNTRVLDAVKGSVVGSPVTIQSVQLEDISFSTAYEQSIEARMLAEVEVQKVTQFVLREAKTAEITVVKAKADAAARVAYAEAEAQSITLKGNAEATAIKARAEALAANQNLVQLQAVEKWNGQLPAQMVPGSAVPFLNLAAK